MLWLLVWNGGIYSEYVELRVIEKKTSWSLDSFWVTYIIGLLFLGAHIPFYKIRKFRVSQTLEMII